MSHTAPFFALALASVAACVAPQQQVGYQATGAGYDNAQSAPATAGGDVVINGMAMSPQQLQGAQIPAGRYWYDPASGLWGLEGGPAAGFIQAGLELGQMSADASGGTTGVYVNGRNLHQQDLMGLQQLLQTVVQPGNYWLDHMGNMGVQGGPALVNLVQVARAQSGGGNGGGGDDNFWSNPRTNATGNSSGGAGYVCVDGSCATYGM